MTDEDQYVRLHAVRAAARFIELMPTLVRCVSDSRWRVRQAAVKALAGFGTTGINELYRCLVTTSDTYSSEQIADEIQLGGIMHDLVAGLASTGADYELAIAVCRKMVNMGKTSLLITALATSRSPQVRVALMHELIDRSLRGSAGGDRSAGRNRNWRGARNRPVLRCDRMAAARHERGEAPPRCTTSCSTSSTTSTPSS